MADEAWDAAENKAFRVLIKSQNRWIDVAADQTLLDALRLAGLNVPSSCREGICGACETAVIAGVPLHRDEVLSEAERLDGHTMMPCVSRAESDTLELDL